MRQRLQLDRLLLAMKLAAADPAEDGAARSDGGAHGLVAVCERPLQTAGTEQESVQG